MIKKTWKIAFTAALFGACAITTSTHSSPPDTLSHLSSETSTSTSSKRDFGRSKKVIVKMYQDGDCVIKKTTEVTVENGLKTTKISEEHTKDGHTDVTTQTKTERLEDRKCCGLKKLKQYIKNHKKHMNGRDCDEKCSEYDDHQDSVGLAGHTAPDYNQDRARGQNMQEESKKMEKKSLRDGNVCHAIDAGCVAKLYKDAIEKEFKSNKAAIQWHMARTRNIAKAIVEKLREQMGQDFLV